ncbi:rhodanese-like domain-containing protein [Lawsonia intracellularis]|uniref:Rhodanese-related sulfurtransferase n=2 Tax=Lawsonia intracellularis TaxID=29546 RepID=Q1MS95_LAWIP|nr:rhodanese domain-containing protein [Lawsonia intracellularis N343]KAA0204995.1 rhodanese-like domain-containing protein [Lawsonia intracellularis]CAJ54130.1 Rhodanese-related sulfurtransferase [Lawsonia intracellularis PHE/MN1-00]MBZ3892481.1 rhodanese-like domain-containing protein [Lawsonia intracellularis]OMQ06137.1 sulfurtransferase [Lawsonia intracellularis]
MEITMSYITILIPALLIVLIWLILQSKTLANIHDHLAITDNDELEILLTKVSAVTLIDVRSSQEFNVGHLTGAINIPLKFLKKSIDTLETTKPIILIGNNSKKLQKVAILLQKRRPDLTLQYIKGTLVHTLDNNIIIKWD